MDNAILKVRNSVKGTGRVPGFVQNFCRERGIPDSVSADICIVLDELLPSLVPITSSPRIRVEIEVEADCLKVSVIQSGEGYDISVPGTVCWPQNAPEARISDLSLHLIHSLINELTCTRINEDNITVFTKKCRA
ncbi:MAG TPA: hypothetical protein VN611_05095 [Patescibacteria group bacterium]|nr:hypothetical protein [Patescibacteria group bacterium]